MRAARLGFYFLRRGWRLTVGSGRNVILGVLAIAMALLLWGVVLLLQGNLSRVLGGFGDQLEARAYLQEDGGDVSAGIVATVGRVAVVGSVRQVTPEQAGAELTRAFPDLAAIAEADAGVVKGYVEWAWRPDVSRLAQAEVVAEVRQMDGVAWLDDDRPWRGRMQMAASRLRVVGLVLGALSVVAAGFVTATVVRLAAFQHRVEIDIERLAGATELYVRAPFLVAGLFQGTAAALVAAGMLYGMWRGAGEVVGDTVLTDLVLGSFLSPERIGALVVVGALAGVTGAAIALRPPRSGAQ